jgi:hypothetical protein
MERASPRAGLGRSGLIAEAAPISSIVRPEIVSHVICALDSDLSICNR